MGFRTMFVSEDFNYDLPQWFIQKYQDYIHMFDGKKFPISNMKEWKMYVGQGLSIFKDIQKVIEEVGIDANMNVIMLHECGGVTKVSISKDKMIYSEPTGWSVTEDITHDYCYGCSEPK